MNAIYVRVSTDEQALKGYSLYDQIASCRQRYLAEGVNEQAISEYIDDGYSGEFLERPALDQLRENIREGFITAVMMYDPDRMSRNLTNQLILADEIEGQGVRLLFVTGDYDASPEGRLFFAMKGAVSAYEKAKIRERTSNGRRQKARKGKIVANADPFGFGWDAQNSMYVIDEEQAAVVRLIYDLCLSNGWGARAIALELASRGILGPSGKPLSVSTVHRILTKELYCGLHYWFRQTCRKTGQNTREIKSNPLEAQVPIPVPSIVSRETWEKVQVQMKRNRKLATRNNQHNYLLRGLVHCGLCGRSMMATGRLAARKTIAAKTYHYYVCITKEAGAYTVSGARCDCRRIPTDLLDNTVWQYLIKIAAGEARLKNFLSGKTAPDYHDKIVDLTTEIASIRHKQTDIMRWYRDNLLDSKAAEKELKDIGRALAAAQARLAELTELQNKIKMPSVNTDDILNASTFAARRRTLLNFPYSIHALRQGDEITFWFSF